MQTRTEIRIKPSVHNGGLYRRFIKRPMDIILSLFAIIILSPVLLIVAILVRIKLGSPVLFKQERPGLNEKIFTLYKFRSMENARDKEGNVLTDDQRLSLLANTTNEESQISDDQRLSKFGKILRASSLDELPELFNILKGDMSFVGPRPLSTLYLPYYNDRERLRHSIRPGLTGWAQVNGRNAISWEQRFDYDVEYAKNVSLRLDLSIIIKTVKVVFQQRDIDQDGEKPLAFHLTRQREWNRAKTTTTKDH